MIQSDTVVLGWLGWVKSEKFVGTPYNIILLLFSCGELLWELIILHWQFFCQDTEQMRWVGGLCYDFMWLAVALNVFPSFNMFRQLFCQDSEQPVAARPGWASDLLCGVTVLWVHVPQIRLASHSPSSASSADKRWELFPDAWEMREAISSPCLDSLWQASPELH